MFISWLILLHRECTTSSTRCVNSSQFSLNTSNCYIYILYPDLVFRTPPFQLTLDVVHDA